MNRPWSPETPGDVIDRIVDPANPLAAAALRQHRPKIVAAVQGAFDALFQDDGGSLDLDTRRACAALVAHLTPEPALAAFYAAGAAPDAGIAAQTPLRQAALAHARRVALAPEEAGPGSLASLRAAGLSERDIVTLSQLIGYVAFQARVICAARALLGIDADAVDGGGNTNSDDADVDLASFKRFRGFTSASLDWQSWLAPVEAARATPEQNAVLDESGPTARTSPYYLTLVHNPDVLRQRSSAYNAIMYAPGGLARADRELAALVVSMLNGCPYCASVHAQRLNQLTRNGDLVERVFADPFTGGADAREQELLRYARRLTLEAGAFDQGDVARLRALGMRDDEIVDFSHVVAIFGWANRLMQTLGAPAPAAGSDPVSADAAAAPVPPVDSAPTSPASGAPHD
ncbi:peroxidase-related enzyme [Robbsia sp. Bb-Pol-6]|uniref:Peroxidase-related enzyme n=1 Tax=Robbsia betulipollinis TaxID=2981849 RepID=A0ABT3ZI50_9BURK|nr:peroxidase-related enzyme [Robbsia betulipollinis]MCY0386201.1 peroxidase-related enzyme [Robbsia betulipollinis]